MMVPAGKRQLLNDEEVTSALTINNNAAQESAVRTTVGCFTWFQFHKQADDE